MSDLIERLERWGRDEGLQNHFIGSRSARKDCAEAATALAEAQAEIARLRGVALFAYVEGWVSAGGHHLSDSGWTKSESFAALSRPHATKGDEG